MLQNERVAEKELRVPQAVAGKPDSLRAKVDGPGGSSSCMFVSFELRKRAQKSGVPEETMGTALQPVGKPVLPVALSHWSAGRGTRLIAMAQTDALGAPGRRREARVIYCTGCQLPKLCARLIIASLIVLRRLAAGSLLEAATPPPSSSEKSAIASPD